MEKIKKELREIINEANPELMELRFGDTVEYEMATQTERGKYNGIYLGENSEFIKIQPTNGNLIAYYGVLEKISNPQFNHLLVTFDKKIEQIEETLDNDIRSIRLSIESDGEIIKITEIKKDGEMPFETNLHICECNLQKDVLSQDDEVLRKLHELLTTK